MSGSLPIYRYKYFPCSPVNGPRLYETFVGMHVALSALIAAYAVYSTVNDSYWQINDKRR